MVGAMYKIPDLNNKDLEFIDLVTTILNGTSSPNTITPEGSLNLRIFGALLQYSICALLRKYLPEGDYIFGFMNLAVLSLKKHNVLYLYNLDTEELEDFVIALISSDFFQDKKMDINTFVELYRAGAV